MARKKQSLIQDMVDVAALLPWWASLLLALILYFILHYYATQPVSINTAGSAFVDHIGSTFYRSLASIGQYILPMVFVFGALSSVLRRRQRRDLFDQANQETGRDAILAMRWDEFELLIGEAFRQKGYAVVERGGAGADGGVDLVATKDGQTALIQCKHWRANKVGVATVRELYGVVMAEGAQAGMVITSGRFTHAATQFAKGKPLKLLDGVAVYQLIR